jgi:hypothetical protein
MKIITKRASFRIVDSVVCVDKCAETQAAPRGRVISVMKKHRSPETFPYNIGMRLAWMHELSGACEVDIRKFARTQGARHLEPLNPCP